MNYNHKNPNSKGRKQWEKDFKNKFVNPYAFISLVGKCNKDSFDIKKFYENKNLLTGWLDCKIETKTLTFIPNTTNDKAFNGNDKNKKSYDFFSYEDLSSRSDLKNIYQEPVIPGSEIRGVIRSAYEALTNSCLSSIDETSVLHKRNNNPKKPGILKKIGNEWKLFSAEKVMLKYKPCDSDPVKIFDISKYNEGQKVYITKSKDKYKNKGFMPYTVTQISNEKFDKSLEGYFHKGEDFEKKKHHESVFIEGSIKKVIEEDVVNRLKNVVEIYQNNGLYNHYTIDGKNNSIYLVYYSDDYEYLSPACITREVFKNRLNNIIEKQGDFGPCKSTEHICETCRLFGMVGSEKSLASRVRFSNAIVNKKNSEKDYYNDIIILSELASPKISATEFYLEKPDDSVLWNYDYAYAAFGKNKLIEKYYPKINGRKFYWHLKPSIDKSYYTFEENNINEKWNERNLVVRPLKPDISFTTKIYFDKITEEELIKLISILNLKISKNDDNENYHKIGMGKPIGFGSIKFDVSEINFRTITISDDMIKYEIDKKTPEDYSSEIDKILNSDKENVKELLKITDFKNRPQNVRYPVAEDNGSYKVYNWFVANRGGVNQYSNNLTLPKISAKDNSLPAYKK